jgi:beta-N-acetylhexosaminidase
VLDRWLRSTIASMSLEQKVGQLFVPYVSGATAETTSAENIARFGVPTPAEAVATFHLGGVIYFVWSGNVESPQQIAALSNGLQRAGSDAGNRVPLSIAIDQETGPGSRIGPPATMFPGAMALGAARDPQLTKSAYAITGQELRAVGINTDYAPDADVNVNPANPVIGVRSFGSEPGLVADLVVAAVEGLQGAWLSATAKHFPGHGDTGQDSHTSLPVIGHTRAEWEEIDAPPFRAAIDAGVDAIMTAHISFPELEPSGDPSTLSKTVLTGLLRDELGFEGVIATDSLRMQGVRTMYDDAEIPVRAIEAGADVLLDPPQPALQIRAVIDAVRSGRLGEKRIEQSVRRILIMKWDRDVITRPYVDLSTIEQTVGTAEHLHEAQRITDLTTTLVMDRARLVPLPSGSVFVTGWGPTQVRRLARGLRQHALGRHALGEDGRDVASSVTGPAPSAAMIDDAVAQARQRDLIIVTTSSAWKDPGQRDLVAALRATGKPVLVVALRDPYDIAYLPGIDSYLAAYSSAPVAIESALRVITGGIRAHGKLPVDITDPENPHEVIHPYGTWR